MEAVEGQDVALPCLLNSTNTQLGNIEWSRRRNETTRLVVYNAMFGLEYFWPDVSIQIENNTMGSYLHLNQVTTRDSGTYVCELSTFPHGSIKRETVLIIRGKTNPNQSRECAPRDFSSAPTHSNFLSNCPLHIFSRCSWLHQSAAPLPASSIIYFGANVWNNCKSTSAIKALFAMTHLPSSPQSACCAPCLLPPLSVSPLRQDELTFSCEWTGGVIIKIGIKKKIWISNLVVSAN